MYQLRVRKPVVLNADQQPLVAGLQAVMPKLGVRDTEFAANLISNFHRWGKLSDKQMHWVKVLTEQVTNPAPAPAPTETVDLSKIQVLFNLASKSLKRVKVRLQTPDGTPVVFGRAGAASKYAGQIMITDGLPFGQNRFFGRIDVNGAFYASRHVTDQVRDLVMSFADDPAGTAGRYGRLTGGCSFCNHGLKDERSTQVGYGPICAKRFGLAWG